MPSRPPRLAASHIPQIKPKQSRQSSLPPEVARLYSTARWQRRRAAQLEQEPLCRACRADNRLTIATVADHVRRATDDQSFWHGELQSLCATHHQSKRQAESHGNPWKPEAKGCDASGMPLGDHHWRSEP